MIGKIIFAGAGSGCADYLTLGALRALQKADAVLYDALVGKEVLDLIPQNVKKIYVGKRSGRISTPQKKINLLLQECVRKYGITVRLKGGDSVLYSRITEEIEAVEICGAEYRIIPGITAASAASAELKLPLTGRRNGSELLFTGPGSFDDQEAMQGIAALLNRGSGVMVYMGGNISDKILSELLKYGAEGSLPILVACNISLPNRRSFHSTLSDIDGSMIKAFSQTDPTLLLIGAPYLSALENALASGF